MLNAVLCRSLWLGVSQLSKVVSETIHTAAIVTRSKRRFAHGDTAHLCQGLVVVRRAGNHVDVGVDVVHLRSRGEMGYWRDGSRNFRGQTWRAGRRRIRG